MEEQWVCQNPDRCRKMASRYGEKKHMGEAKVKEALRRSFVIDIEGLHIKKVTTNRVISYRDIRKILFGLINEDPDVYAEVIDCHQEKQRESITIHGIVGIRHLHIVVDVSKEDEMIHVITAYDPADEPEIWDKTFSKRICFCPKKERRNFYRSRGRDVY